MNATTPQGTLDMLARLLSLFEVDLKVQAADASERVEGMHLAVISNVADYRFLATFVPSSDGHRMESYTITSDVATDEVRIVQASDKVWFESAVGFEYRTILQVLDGLLRANLAEVAQIVTVAGLIRFGRKAQA